MAKIHAVGLLVIPNYNTYALGDTNVLRVTNLTDGILAESGFTIWYPVPNTTSATTPPPFTNPTKFAV